MLSRPRQGAVPEIPTGYLVKGAPQSGDCGTKAADALVSDAPRPLVRELQLFLKADATFISCQQKLKLSPALICFPN